MGSGFLSFVLRVVVAPSLCQGSSCWGNQVLSDMYSPERRSVALGIDEWRKSTCPQVDQAGDSPDGNL